ncbi:MAG: tRNA (guanosine(46)-N7)-methyltransferase TrmB [Clostridia bacterium]|nr:tRNA (guanosine(46)-N7)-methyltransferase TrmB [Clostridia bacterium]
MRMRKRKNVRERLLKCAGYVIENPVQNKGKWKDVFGNSNPVHVEIGCGKGGFITGMALKYPQINFIAVEICTDVIVLAVEKAFERQIDNLKFICCDAKTLSDIFECGECDRIYLNFSDPWPKSRHCKRRLTYKDFLDIYRHILKSEGEIYLKTDNMHFFEFSIESLSQNDFKMKNVSVDLHNSNFKGNIMTEYEKRFSDMGKPIYRLEAY